MVTANQIVWFLNEPFLHSKLSKYGPWTLKDYCISRINWFFGCWYKIMQIKRMLKILGVVVVKNGCGQSYDGTLKLTLSEEWTNGINWFLACSWRFTFKSWSKIYWVGMVKNGRGQSGLGTLKYITWFFAC